MTSPCPVTSAISTERATGLADRITALNVLPDAVVTPKVTPPSLSSCREIHSVSTAPSPSTATAGAWSTSAGMPSPEAGQPVPDAPLPEDDVVAGAVVPAEASASPSPDEHPVSSRKPTRAPTTGRRMGSPCSRPMTCASTPAPGRASGRGLLGSVGALGQDRQDVD